MSGSKYHQWNHYNNERVNQERRSVSRPSSLDGSGDDLPQISSRQSSNSSFIEQNQEDRRRGSLELNKTNLLMPEKQQLQIQKQLEKKQVEQLLQQIQEQLQLNIIQQTTLLQTGGKSSPTLQQLQIQQQQLLAQFQLLQQHSLNDELLDRKPLQTSPKEEFVPKSLGSSPCSTPVDDPKYSPPSPFTLYQNGVCGWTGCEVLCKNDEAFINHLSSLHLLDDKSTAQTRVQLQIVNQLEVQLAKERLRLDAMMAHLYAPQETRETKISITPPLISNGPFQRMAHSEPLSMDTGTIRQNHQENGDNIGYEDSVSRSHRLERGRLYFEDTENEINKNRIFYKNNEVRPPFTYAALIRQSIKESRDGQLTLNDIYNWFISNFIYFRQNTATWKNAVRHNLSLHKCFMRVENVKGAVWTVNEMEYHRRRPQRGVSGQNVQPERQIQTGDHSSLSLQSRLALVNPGGEGVSLFSSRDTRSPTTDTRDNRSPTIHGGESPPRMDLSMERCNAVQDPAYNITQLIKREVYSEQEVNYYQKSEKSPSELRETHVTMESRMTPPLSPQDRIRLSVRCDEFPVNLSEGPQDLSMVKSRHHTTQSTSPQLSV